MNAQEIERAAVAFLGHLVSDPKCREDLAQAKIDAKAAPAPQTLEPVAQVIAQYVGLSTLPTDDEVRQMQNVLADRSQSAHATIVQTTAYFVSEEANIEIGDNENDNGGSGGALV